MRITGEMEELKELSAEFQQHYKLAIEKATAKLKITEDWESIFKIETSDDESVFQRIEKSLEKQMEESDYPNHLKTNSIFYIGRAYSLQNDGKYAQASEWYQKGVDMAEKMVLLRGSRDDKKNLWNSYLLYGDFLREIGNPKEALNI